MYDVIVIGAGPSGLMAAIEASKKARVLLIEKNETLGKKLLITGNGRCNVTNFKNNNLFLETVGYNKKYLYSAINKFGPSEIIAFFAAHGVPLKEEEDNKMFPKTDEAKDILNALIKNMPKVTIKYGETVTDIMSGIIKKVITSKGAYTAANVIIAVGGASYPETGSAGDNLKFAKMLKQPVVDIFPAETSVEAEIDISLAGTSFLKATVKFNNKEFTDALIFTHKGLSGPVIMQASEHIHKEKVKEIHLDMMPAYQTDDFVNALNNFDREKELSSFFSYFFTKKLSNHLVQMLNLNKKIKSLTKSEITSFINFLKNYPVKIKKVSNIASAFVTGGGIDMNYIDSTRMESKINQGIYFVGEALDIHGPIGGYNITLALATGYLAGSSINGKTKA